MITSVPAQTAAPATASGTRALLACGAAAGPLFVVVAGLQAAFRDGYDLRRHPLSLLALGDLGWIQTANFVLTGLLCLAAGLGMARVRWAGRWTPRLVGAYGVGLVLAGVFRADPSLGFPAGAPTGGGTDNLSGHAILHGVAAMIAFTAVSVATFVLARRFVREGRRGWAACSVATGVTALALFAAPTQAGYSVRLAIGSALVFGWLVAVSLDLRDRA